MNSNFLKYLVLITIVGLVVFSSSCKKPDDVIPEIALYKDSVDTIILNAKLIDPGAYSKDNVDGDISPDIVSDYLTVINKDSVGIYTVTYRISDKAGNINTVRRRVYVMNQAQIWEGTYNAIDTLFNLPITSSADTFRKTYQVKIRASWYKNNVFWIGGYGKYTAPGYSYINLIAYVSDSSSIFNKANIPQAEQPLLNLTYSPATSCATTSHRIKSLQSFYLYNTNPKSTFIEYEDDVFEPATCVALKRGKLKLTYSGGL